VCGVLLFRGLARPCGFLGCAVGRGGGGGPRGGGGGAALLRACPSPSPPAAPVAPVGPEEARALSADGVREERGKCAVCIWVTSSFPVHLKHIPHRA